MLCSSHLWVLRAMFELPIESDVTAPFGRRNNRITPSTSHYGEVYRTDRSKVEASAPNARAYVFRVHEVCQVNRRSLHSCVFRPSLFP